jgi:hypothetical protein
MAKHSSPTFEDFTRWVAAQGKASSAGPPSPAVVAEARSARDEMLRQLPAPTGRRTTLQLLAAATDDAGLPPELTTAHGFRVSIVYGESPKDTSASLCVLVQCPHDLIPAVVGRTAYLWNGNQRFELGEFDSEGKAIGSLPAGIEITASDLTRGSVQLEEPHISTDDG